MGEVKSDLAGAEPSALYELVSNDRGILGEDKDRPTFLRVAEAAVDDKDVIRRCVMVAALQADERQRAALPTAYLCEGIMLRCLSNSEAARKGQLPYPF